MTNRRQTGGRCGISGGLRKWGGRTVRKKGEGGKCFLCFLTTKYTKGTKTRKGFAPLGEPAEVPGGFFVVVIGGGMVFARRRGDAEVDYGGGCHILTGKALAGKQTVVPAIIVILENKNGKESKS